MSEQPVESRSTSAPGAENDSGTVAAPTERPDAVLQVRGLKVHFPIRQGIFFDRQVGAVQAVDGVDLDIARGRTFGLVGESGCGKSTLGRAVLRLVEPTAGSVIFDGTDVGTLDRVGLPASAASRYPHEFSGGQRQRIGIARAVALEPELVIADEPVSALDVSIQAQVINLLEELQERLGLTYMVIAHDLAVVRHISEEIAVMYLGGIVEQTDTESLYREPMHPYTIALMSAVPVPDPLVEDSRQRILLTGDIPSPANPPPGCRFHTRCAFRQPTRCDDERPELAEAVPGHMVACHYVQEIMTGQITPQEPEQMLAASPSA